MKRIVAGVVILKDAAWLALRRLPALGIQAGGALLAGLIFCGLLNVPESHVWDVAISAMFWPALAVGTLWLQVIVFRRMRSPEHRWPLMFAVPVLLVWVAVWVVIWIYLARVADNFGLYAGYLNSRLPAPGRAMLTFERLSGLMEDLYLIVQWWLVPGILLPCMVETVTSGVRGGVWKRITSVWRGWVWWAALIVVQVAASFVTKRLLVWHPHLSARTELLSAFGRVLTIYVVDVVLWYLLLAVLAVYLIKAASQLNATTGGTPVVSQPVTDDKP